jgi:hypothetical protein
MRQTLSLCILAGVAAASGCIVQPIAPAAGDAGTVPGSDAAIDGGTPAGADSGTDAGADAGSTSRPDAGVDAGVDAGTDAGINCSGTNEPMFPTLDDVCSTSADCSIGLHQTDCCGNLSAVGLNNSAVSTFNTDEVICVGMYPGCGCAGGVITCDDGSRTFDRTKLGVVCDAGACWTFSHQ